MKTEFFSINELEKAVKSFRRGELVAFPTETVYGLGAPVFSEDSIVKIFNVKGRPQDNPLIVHIATPKDCEKIAKDLPKIFFQLAETFFPGPLTLIVKKKEVVPGIVSAGLPTVAIRMPDHPIAEKLIELVGEPLVAPSANISGSPSSTRAEHVAADFFGKIAGIIDGGPCLHGLESTVLDLVSFAKPTLLRPGSISKEQIEGVLGFEIDQYSKGPKSSPGMKYRHYAPKARVRHFTDLESMNGYLEQHPDTFILSDQKLSTGHYSLEPETFYANLRLADEKGYDEIVILCRAHADAALCNRLEKIINESDFT